MLTCHTHTHTSHGNRMAMTHPGFARSAAALLALLIVPLAHGQDGAPKGGKITTAEDLTYSRVGDVDLKLDIAAPEGDGPFPGLVVIHGGGWRGGNKKDVRAVLAECARRGYVAISPQYRF